MNVAELESLRKKARNIILTGAFFSIVPPLVLIFWSKSLEPFLFGLLGFFLTYLISSSPRKKFSIAFKQTFVLHSLEKIFSNLHYEPTSGIAESVIRNTQTMDMGDRYFANDYISGKYKNIDVIQSDIHIEERRESLDRDDRDKWVTIFKGKWMIFDFNKNFKANVQVCQKGFKNSKLNNWGIWGKGDERFKKIKLENQLFNKNFKIYAQNEHDAFYILTPSLMEKIQKLINTIDGKVILCFLDNKLHVGIQNNKDSFEHSIFKKINENKVIQTISKDIKLITSFVDELDLDNDLFRREV